MPSQKKSKGKKYQKTILDREVVDSCWGV